MQVWIAGVLDLEGLWFVECGLPTLAEGCGLGASQPLPGKPQGGSCLRLHPEWSQAGRGIRRGVGRHRHRSLEIVGPPWANLFARRCLRWPAGLDTRWEGELQGFGLGFFN